MIEGGRTNWEARKREAAELQVDTLYTRIGVKLDTEGESKLGRFLASKLATIGHRYSIYAENIANANVLAEAKGKSPSPLDYVTSVSRKKLPTRDYLESPIAMTEMEDQGYLTVPKGTVVFLEVLTHDEKVIQVPKPAITPMPIEATIEAVKEEPNRKPQVKLNVLSARALQIRRELNELEVLGEADKEITELTDPILAEDIIFARTAYDLAQSDAVGDVAWAFALGGNKKLFKKNKINPTNVKSLKLVTDFKTSEK